MRPQRFFWKSFLSFFLVIAFCSSVFGGLLYRQLAYSTLDALKNDLRKETLVLAGIMANTPDLMNDPKRVAGFVHIEDRITIIQPDGVVLADNWAAQLGKEALENHANRPEVRAALAGTPIFERRFSNTIQKELLYYAYPLKKDGHIALVLRLSFALDTYKKQMNEVRNFLITSAFLSILISLVLIYGLARGGTEQIERLRAGARSLAEGNLSNRIEPSGSLEFQQLAVDLNRMADELGQKIHSIKQEHGRTETLLSKMVEGVLAIDGRGKAVFVNPAFCSMFGSKNDRVQGRSYLEVIRNDQLSEFISGLLKDRNHAVPESSEIRLFGPEGEKVFSVQASRIYEEDQSVSLILLVFHDITGIKRVEQIRRDFVANVSHELRTPLTALKGSTEILLDGAYQNPEESKKFLEILDKQLRNIQNLVTDMLKLAAVEDSRTAFRREPVELHEFVNDVVALVKPLSTRKKQDLQIRLPEERLDIQVDEGQFSDALLNLLDNAIKYTQEKGTVELAAFAENGTMRFEIKDNGPGIPRDQLPRIFERFYRIDKSRSREMGGTGLGLAIAKHIVENHGGSISVQSELGSGTLFIIQIPRK